MCITAKISHKSVSFSAVQIFDLGFSLVSANVFRPRGDGNTWFCSGNMFFFLVFSICRALSAHVILDLVIRR